MGGTLPRIGNPKGGVSAHAFYGWRFEDCEACGCYTVCEGPSQYRHVEPPTPYPTKSHKTIAGKWPLIETAPRDGTPIMVARYIESFGWVRGWAQWVDERGISGWISRGFFEPPGNLGLGHPTHWHPIPDLTDPPQ